MSRHRGAKHRRRYELLGGISLLSPEYLLSVERWPFHSEPPDHYDLLSHLLELLLSRSQACLCHCTDLTMSDRNQADLRAPPLPFRRRPPQSNFPPDTVLFEVFIELELQTCQGGISRLTPHEAGALASMSPAYPAQTGSKFSVKLQ